MRKWGKTAKTNPDQSKSLSEEEKNEKKEYARNRNHMPEEDQQKFREQNKLNS